MKGASVKRIRMRIGTAIFLGIAALVGQSAMAAPGDITTIAGGSNSGNANLSTADFALTNPQGVSVDSSGNIFVVDTAAQYVRKFPASGGSSVVAGNGSAGFTQQSRWSQSGTKAAKTQLNYPNSVTIDSSGNLFIADTRNQMVRKVDTSGTISTVAGNGRSDASGNGLGCPFPQLPDQCGTFLGDGTTGLVASLNKPSGVAVGSDGSVYIADTNDNRIRKVDANGLVSTIAGTGGPSFSGDGGPATAAALKQPWGLALSGTSLFVADTGNNRIRVIDLNTGVISTVAGNGSASSSGDGGSATGAGINFPAAVAVDGAGNVIIAETKGHKIRRVDSTGTISTLAGTGTSGFSGDGGSASSSLLSDPYGVAVTSAGDVLIADTWNDRIRKVSGGTITTVVGPIPGVFCCNDDGVAGTNANTSAPGDAVSFGGNVYFTDTAHNRVVRINPDGTVLTIAGVNIPGFSGDGGPATSAKLNLPQGIAADSAGNLFISDTANHRIRKISTAGVITTVGGTGVKGYTGDGGAATSAQLGDPYGIAVDGAGNVYFADAGNDRIRKIDSGGTISTVAGSGIVGAGSRGMSGDGGPATSAHLNNPRGIAVDSAGNLFIADTRNSKIRKVNTAGIISTFAGKGPLPCTSLTCDQGAYLGDDGAATDAYLNNPWDVAVDPSGNVWIADTSNSAVRKVDTTGTITSAGGGFPLLGGSQSSPQGVGADASGDVYVADTGSDTILKISAT